MKLDVAHQMSEADLQKSVVDLAHLYRWQVAHFRSVRVRKKDGSTFWQTPVAADGEGFPDCILVRDSRCMAWELKSETGRVAAKQQQWLNGLEQSGIDARVIRPSDWLDGTVEKLLR